ncbi:hypothetical protein DV737_g3521, partial [Chaetothyriales sp. CBS 132003]
MSTKLSLTSTLPQPSGYPIPVLGLGVYQTPVATAESVVLHALKHGYRHIDSARAYRNEVPCAAAIKASGIPRSEIFFTSKIMPKRMMGYEKAKESIASTLAETGLDYVDLYLIHAPYGGKTQRLGAWQALVEAQHEGKIRSIGVSNYGVHHLDELADFIATSDNPLIKQSKIDVNQVELHPWLPRQDIVDWCNKHGVIVEAYCPLVRGERANEPVLQQIGEKHGGRSWAQVLLRWSLQRGFVSLPKSETASRIEANAHIFDFELDDQDMAALDFPDSYAPIAWDPTVAKLEE